MCDSEVIHIRVPCKVADFHRQAAEDEGVSISEYVRQLLIKDKAAKERQRPSKKSPEGSG